MTAADSTPQWSNLPWVGQRRQEIDAAVPRLDACFSERTSEEISEDTTDPSVSSGLRFWPQTACAEMPPISAPGRESPRLFRSDR